MDILVKLLGEDTDVWITVPARQIRDGIFELGASEMLKLDDVTPEFLPGSHVRVRPRLMSDSKVELVAVSLVRPPTADT